jgi:hypothetical protein
LYASLAKLRPTIDAKQSAVKIQAPGVLLYTNLVEIMDKVRLAKFTPGFEKPTEGGKTEPPGG